MVVSHRFDAPACRKQKSPSTGVADWTGRRGLKVCGLVSNRMVRISPLGGASQVQYRTRLSVGDG